MLEESIFSDRSVGSTMLPPPALPDRAPTPQPMPTDEDAADEDAASAPRPIVAGSEPESATEQQRVFRLPAPEVLHDLFADVAPEPVLGRPTHELHHQTHASDQAIAEASAKFARKAMRRRRRLDRVIGRVAIVVVLAALAGAGYAAYTAFGDGQSENGFQPTDDEPAETNGFEIVGEPAQLTSPLAIATVLPPEITLMAHGIDPAAGFVRYIVDADLAVNSQRQQAGDWLRVMRGLPQTSAISQPSIVPDLVSGQMLVAYTSSDGVQVDRLIVLNPDENIVVDAAAP